MVVFYFRLFEVGNNLAFECGLFFFGSEHEQGSNVAFSFCSFYWSSSVMHSNRQLLFFVRKIRYLNKFTIDGAESMKMELTVLIQLILI